VRADELVASFNTLETALSAGASDTATELSDSIQSVRTRLDSVRSEPATADTALEEQLACDLDSLTTNVSTVSTDLATLSTDLDTLETDTDQLVIKAARFFLDVAPLYEQAKDSIVKILDNGDVLGSDFIYGSEYVINAWHVVLDIPGGDLSVRTTDGTEINASVAGKNISEDVAVLRPTHTVSPPLPLPRANSSQLTIGQPVLVTGGPIILDGSASSGIISDLERAQEKDFEDTACEFCTDLVQIDTTAASSNSGGPVFHSDGKVIGIILLGHISSDTKFALPSNVVKTPADSVIGS
jgi:S1-C subfamily serine protease